MSATRGLLLVRGAVCSWRAGRVLLAVGAGCSRGLALGGWAVRGFRRAAARLRPLAEEASRCHDNATPHWVNMNELDKLKPWAALKSSERERRAFRVTPPLRWR